MTDDYSNAQGYGIFCGRKCVAKKQAQGIAPKRSGKGGKHDAAWEALQNDQVLAAAADADADAAGGGSSKTPLIIGGLLVVAAIVTVVILKTRK